MPIKGQYSSHMIFIIQSQVSIQVTRPVLTNQRLILRSHDLDLYQPITGQYSGHVTSIDQLQYPSPALLLHTELPAGAPLPLPAGDASLSGVRVVILTLTQVMTMIVTLVTLTE